MHILFSAPNPSQDGQETLKQVLTGDILAKAPDFTLSIPNWEYYKAVILLKSSYFRDMGAQIEVFDARLEEVRIYGARIVDVIKFVC